MKVRTINDALKFGTAVLKTAGVEAPVFEAGVILCRILDCDKVFIYSHGDECICEDLLTVYSTSLSRRAEGVPLQYITGRQEFMSLDFSVDTAVLIPRQETETLVETVISYIRTDYIQDCKVRGDKPEAVILDIGTGSGCIAASLAFYLKKCRVVALDISQNALQTARNNAYKNGVLDRIEFYQSDLFRSLPARYLIKSAFDVVVSNPPYIPTKEIFTLKSEVKDHEPFGALDGGLDGLSFYRTIVNEAPGTLKPDGLLAFEVGCGQAGHVFKMMTDKFYKIDIVKDLSGIERVVAGRLKP